MIILIPFFLCWGSFLNVLAYRLVREEQGISPLLTFPSHCPHCKKHLAWYDNIPLISFILLRGKCRSCTKPISWLYPFIELFTVCALTALYMRVPIPYFFAYFIFFSALIVTLRSDLETLLISRYMTLALVPIGLLCSIIGWLPISVYASVAGAFIGYFLLFTIAKIFYAITGRHGIGQGDLDLLAFIGSFTGLFGLWASLLIGSLSGTFFGLFYLLFTKQSRSAKIPFGPFLAIGAIIFVLFAQEIALLFFPHLQA